MSFLRSVGRPFKQYLRRFTGSARLSSEISPYLPATLCIDVGASYYPHVKWRLFLNSPHAHWVAVEPNVANLGYVARWAWACQVSTCTTGLSREGGAQTLYVTNVDSGSSLLEPVIPQSMASRIRNLDYFFPVRTRSIDTITLGQLIDEKQGTAPAFVKLDTQGTELSILSGAQRLLESRRIVGIESELTMLSEPVMKGAGKFWQACQYLENFGYELLHVSPIYGPSRFGRAQPRGYTFLNECDTVFALRRDVAAGLPVAYRAALAAFYLANRFHEEALALLREDAEVAALLAARGCNVDKLVARIGAMA